MPLYQLHANPIAETTRFGRIKQLRGWGHNRRAPREHLLAVITEGSCQITTEQQTQSFHEKELFFLPAGTYYTSDTTHGCEYCFFHFFTQQPIQCITEQAAAAILEPVPAVFSEAPAFQLHRSSQSFWFLRDKMAAGSRYLELMSLIAQFSQLIHVPAYDSKFRADLLFSQILALLSGCCVSGLPGRPNLPASLIRLLEYIDQNITRPITLTELSEHAGLSAQYLLRLFHRYLGISAGAYINRAKLSYAMQLLTYSSMNVSEIADYLGFHSVSYFSRLFKKQLSVSPSAYASNARRS